MPKFIDMTGKKIGRVKILSYLSVGEKIKKYKWNCKCNCGYEFTCWPRSFKRGKKFECEKCFNERRRGIDLTGKEFGRWTVLKRVIDKYGATAWHCRCECGKERQVEASSLGKKGRSMSCGCLGRKEKSKWVNDTLYPPQHLTSFTRIYKIRERIVHSCYKPSHQIYKHYGAKGYTVCDLWKNGAEDFFNWCMENKWKPNHVIGIKDGETHFCPENCFVIEEGEHIRQRQLKKITFNNITKTTVEWAKETGLSHRSLNRRLLNGYTEEEAIFSRAHQFSGTKEWPDEKIKNLYQSGLTLTSIAEKLKSTTTGIRKRLELMNVPLCRKSRTKYTEKECTICTKEYLPTSSTQKKCQICKLNRK